MFSSSAKVFIWDHEYASKESIADLKEYFTSETIFTYRPDVTVITQFPNNIHGIVDPVLVVPGGSSIILAKSFYEALNRTTMDFLKRYHYVGSCAGGFIGTDNMNLFYTREIERGIAHYHALPFYDSFSPSYSQYSIKAVTDFKSIGPFRPTDAFPIDEPKAYIPYRVQLAVSGSQKPLTQLFVNGAGFIPNDRNSPTKTKSSVVATYSDKNRYRFTFSKAPDPYGVNQAEHENLAAMLRTKAIPGKHGARFLSGTHFEACVPDSQMMKCFMTGTKYPDKAALLSQDDLDKFESEREETKATMDGLLRETFRL